MKLPYRAGDSFALPLGDGRRVRARIERCEHRLVIFTAFDDDGKPLGTLRASDEALVAQRWRRCGRETPNADAAPENGAWMHAASAERTIAQRCGVTRATILNHRAIERFGGVPIPASVDCDTTIAVTDPLSSDGIDALHALVTRRPRVMLRVGAEPASQLNELLRAPLQRLTIAGEIALPPGRGAQLEELWVAADIPVAEAAAFAPNVRVLRYASPKARLDARELARFERLASVDCSTVTLERVDALARLTSLESLRISRIDDVEDANALALPSLRSLAVEGLPRLHAIDALARCTNLEQLEVIGLWQFDIAELEWTLALPSLLRAEIDIGGRRKNVELYRRAAWAYPWPFGR